MYQATVLKIKRGFFGPKQIEVFHETSPYAEPLIAEMSRYDDDHHVKIFKDMVASHGDWDDRDPSPVREYDFDEFPDDEDADGWDPTTRRAFIAQPVDDELPF